MKRNTYYAIAASVLIFCTIINYGMSNLESTGGTRSHSGGLFASRSGSSAVQTWTARPAVCAEATKRRVTTGTPW